MDDKTKISKYASKKREVINNLIKHLSLEKNKSKFMKAVNYWKGELKLSDEVIFNKYSNRQLDYIKFRLASNLVKLYELEKKNKPDMINKPNTIFELFKSVTVSVSDVNKKLSDISKIVDEKFNIAFDIVLNSARGLNENKYSSFAGEMLKIYTRMNELTVTEDKLKLQTFKILWRGSEQLGEGEKQKRQNEIRAMVKKNLLQ